ncbi:MAG: tyrosine-type recombinase/integrase [Chthonomonadales bacterium]
MQARVVRVRLRHASPQRPNASDHVVQDRLDQGAEERRGKCRWHDNRHTLVTELAESGAGDEVIMSIAGHVSRAMLSRYSHVRMEAKRRALDEIAERQNAADEKRRKLVS